MNPNILQNKFAHIYFLARAHTHTHRERERGRDTHGHERRAQSSGNEAASKLLCDLRAQTTTTEVGAHVQYISIICLI